MSKITHLSPEWQSWILENLDRGCTPQSLVEVMVEKNFDPMFANAIVFHFVSTSGKGQGATAVTLPGAESGQQRALKSGYVYETPRIPMHGGVIKTADRDVKVVMRIEKPVVVVFDNLLSHEECDEMVRLSEKKLKRSAIVDPTTGRDEIIDDRTSFGTFFHVRESEFVAKLDERISQLMHWPVEKGEGIQILNYQVGGEYKPHYDYFPPQDQGSHVHLRNGGQRVSTLIMYLNDVEDGGETIFPELGLAVAPRKGSAVYFEYCNRSSQVDPLTLHGGAPVRRGEKWIATKWMREQNFT
ncbi:2OG-Fe(II) oxygenase [Chitinolyticbacter meiyuanensis]|uniref:2OG-Fe(II) oxygenase n=1 Tax=Chitinolyticbacter meiyuanensis TaxID=682798 RepID=UPI0011E5E135|nr:2OG-Fe(II) oxygenase [Chitinolyticbacter meiyuanensis]